jgi:hypothetical protein
MGDLWISSASSWTDAATYQIRPKGVSHPLIMQRQFLPIMVALLVAAPAAHAQTRLEIGVSLSTTPNGSVRVQPLQSQGRSCGKVLGVGFALGVVVGTGFVWWDGSGEYARPTTTADYVFIGGLTGLLFGGLAWGMCQDGLPGLGFLPVTPPATEQSCEGSSEGYKTVRGGLALVPPCPGTPPTRPGSTSVQR